MSATIMCGLLCVAFSFNDEGVQWIWKDAKPVAVILGIIAVISGVFWLKASKKLMH